MTVTSSDDLLDAGTSGLDFFRDFGPLYREWQGSGPDPAQDVQDSYDNLRGIRFDAFRADAAQLSTTHGKLTDSTANLVAHTGSLGGFWHGEAADAAQRYCATFVGHGQTVTDGLGAAGQVIDHSMQAIESAVRQRAQGVRKLAATDVGGFSADQVRQIVAVARGTAADATLRAMSTWPALHDVDWGDDADCTGKLSENVRHLAATDAANWLNHTFVPAFEQRKQAFDSISTATHTAVGQAFDSMNQGLAEIDPNPFGGHSGPSHAVPAGGGHAPARHGFTEPAQASAPAGAAEPAPMTGFVDPSLLPAGQVTSLSAAESNLGGNVDASGVSDGFDNALGGAVGNVVDPVSAHHHAQDALGGPIGQAGLADTNVTPLGQPGDVGLASAPQGALDGGGAQQGGESGGMGGAMPMMGGMGMGMGAQAGDQQHKGQHWRTDGRLFDDIVGDDGLGGFNGTLEER